MHFDKKFIGISSSRQAYYHKHIHIMYIVYKYYIRVTVLKIIKLNANLFLLSNVVLSFVTLQIYVDDAWSQNHYFRVSFI